MPGTPLGQSKAVRRYSVRLYHIGQGAQFLEQPTMALEVGPEQFGNRQDIVAVRHGGEHVVQDEAGVVWTFFWWQEGQNQRPLCLGMLTQGRRAFSPLGRFSHRGDRFHFHAARRSGQSAPTLGW